MGESFPVGSRVRIFLNHKFWKKGAWFEGTVVRIEPYSQFRSFYWVELDEAEQARVGLKMVSVLNPRNIEKIE
jgi:hypothetical protein